MQFQTCEALRMLCDAFHSSRSFPASIIIYGPSGSGKTSMCTLLLHEMMDVLKQDASRAHKFILKAIKY